MGRKRKQISRECAPLRRMTDAPGPFLPPAQRLPPVNAWVAACLISSLALDLANWSPAYSQLWGSRLSLYAIMPYWPILRSAIRA